MERRETGLLGGWFKYNLCTVNLVKGMKGEVIPVCFCMGISSPTHNPAPISIKTYPVDIVVASLF